MSGVHDPGESQGLADLRAETLTDFLLAMSIDVEQVARVIYEASDEYADWLAAREALARAEAWDQGRRFGQIHWASNYWPEVKHRPDPNPYRADSPDYREEWKP